MKLKNFFKLLLVACLVLSLSSVSMAAAKKSTKRKASAAQDKVEQILKAYKPFNKTNANIIRSILKKYGGSHVLAITTDVRKLSAIFELVSVKTGKKQLVAVKVDKDFPLIFDVDDEELSFFEFEYFCMMSYYATTQSMSFYNDAGQYVESYDGAAQGAVADSFSRFSELLDNNNFFGKGDTPIDRNTAYLPILLMFK